MKPLYEDNLFRIIKTNRDYILIRTDLDYKNHAHFKNIQGAKLCKDLFYKQQIPYKRYFRGSMKRITTDEEYSQFSNQKPKDKCKKSSPKFLK